MPDPHPPRRLAATCVTVRVSSGAHKLLAAVSEDIRTYRKAQQRLRVGIRRHERPGKDALEVVIVETET